MSMSKILRGTSTIVLQNRKHGNFAPFAKSIIEFSPMLAH